MNKKNIRTLSLAIILFSIFAPVFFANAIPITNPSNAFADRDIKEILVRVVWYAASFVGILGIIFLVWGGILYVTAAGDDNQIEQAKSTIKFAIIGVFAAGIAYAAVKFILEKLIS